jgi:transcriptional regulator with XRE-family HTH domain
MPSAKDISNVRFGAALSRARRFKGMSQEALAGRVGCSKSHISNVERGDRPMMAADVKKADDALDAGGRLNRLRTELYEPQQLDWLDKLHQLQQGAELIREYHNSLVPGLLQTPGYAAEVIAASAPWCDEDEVADRVATRMSRSQKILDNRGVHYQVVLDDMVVKRPIGTPRVMVDQCRRLLTLASEGRVILQFHPWDQWPHPGVAGPLSLISSAAAPDVLHVESIYLGQTADDPTAVRRYGMLFSRLQVNARSQPATMRFLHDVIKEHEDGDEAPVAQG